MQGVREYFRSSPFLYLYDSQVRMIEGWEEGVFSFFASNYLKKEFPLVSLEKLFKEETFSLLKFKIYI